MKTDARRDNNFESGRIPGRANLAPADDRGRQSRRNQLVISHGRNKYLGARVASCRRLASRLPAAGQWNAHESGGQK